jgi:hypothetical protein
MLQVAHPDAPFPDIDRAISAGHDYARHRGSIVGIIAEPQPGGYFARVCYTTGVGGKGRRARNARQSHTVEIGKIDGPAFHPIDNKMLSGRPYLCATCEEPWGREPPCERWIGCEIEDASVAQGRLVEAHQRGEGMPTP